jgi:hypothetical protein
MVAGCRSPLERLEQRLRVAMIDEELRGAEVHERMDPRRLVRELECAVRPVERRRDVLLEHRELRE